MNIRKKIDKYGKSAGRKAEIVRFALTGGAATLLQYGLYILFLSVFNLSAVVSNVISYVVSLCFNYVVSNLFTFRTQPTRKNALYFLLSHMFNLGLQTLLVYAFSKVINPELALLPALAVCVPCNFLLVSYALKSH